MPKNMAHDDKIMKSITKVCSENEERYWKINNYLEFLTDRTFPLIRKSQINEKINPHTHMLKKEYQ